MILITRSMRIFTEMEVGVNKFGLKKIVRPRGKDKYDEATGANLGQVWHDIINFECLIPTNCMLILKERWNLLIETVAKEKERELSTGELRLGRAERRRRSRCGGRRNWPRPTFDAHGALRGEDAVERPWEPGPCALPRPTLAGAWRRRRGFRRADASRGGGHLRSRHTWASASASVKQGSFIPPCRVPRGLNS